MSNQNRIFLECIIAAIVPILIGGMIIVSLTSCDDTTITEVIECQLPPGHCNMDDEEFAAMFDALTAEEQAAYIGDWGQPEDQREGFVTR